MCLTCHDPHTSDNTALLVEGGNILCESCHEEQTRKAPFPHAAVAEEDGCLSCHAPHAASAAGLLLAPDAELCATCHGKVAAANPAMSVTTPPPRATIAVPRSAPTESNRS